MMRPAAPLLLMLVAACSGDNPEAPAAPVRSEAAAPLVSPSETRAADTLPVAARKVRESNELYEFSYAYPAAAGVIPALKGWFDADIEKQRAALIGQARQEKEARVDGNFPYNPLGRWIEWKVVTDLPGYLRLSASVSTYEGGAHPNHFSDALIWDRQAGVRREPIDLFTSKQALSQSIRDDFCRALDRERSRRRGERVRRDSGNPFDECIDPVENTVILGSSHGKAFDRLGVLVAPYSAGPYAEGDYDVTLPVTEAVLAAVKPQFRPAFVVSR